MMDGPFTICFRILSLLVAKASGFPPSMPFLHCGLCVGSHQLTPPPNRPVPHPYQQPIIHSITSLASISLPAHLPTAAATRKDHLRQPSHTASQNNLSPQRPATRRHTRTRDSSLSQLQRSASIRHLPTRSRVAVDIPPTPPDQENRHRTSNMSLETARYSTKHCMARYTLTCTI